VGTGGEGIFRGLKRFGSQSRRLENAGEEGQKDLVRREVREVTGLVCVLFLTFKLLMMVPRMRTRVPNRGLTFALLVSWKR